jgi:putative redox protein
MSRSDTRETKRNIMSHTASARSVGGTLRQEIEVNRRHTIATDEPASLGGNDTAPTPHELVPAMLAACVSTMIVLYAQRREWQIGEVRVDVNYDADSTPRRVEVTVHLPDGLTDEQIERLRRVADTCPVKRALEAGFTFEQQLVLDVSAVDPGHRGELPSRLHDRTDARHARRRDPVSHDR